MSVLALVLASCGDASGEASADSNDNNESTENTDASDDSTNESEGSLCDCLADANSGRGINTIKKY